MCIDARSCWAAGALLQAGRGVLRADPGLAVEALVVRRHLLDLLVLARVDFVELPRGGRTARGVDARRVGRPVSYARGLRGRRRTILWKRSCSPLSRLVPSLTSSSGRRLTTP